MTIKYKFISFLFLGFIGLSLTTKSQYPKIDLRNMVRVEPSTFIMGIDSTRLKKDIERFNAPASLFSQEYPFRVTVVPFYIDKYEVTNAEFKKFIDANPKWSKSNIPDSLHDGNYLKDWNENKYPKSTADYPVVYVNWRTAAAYAAWKGKRLPMDVEWESAAKGSDKYLEFPWGNTDADITKANYLQSQIGHPVKTGSYPPNSLGLYDMAGNVKEFCLDRWHTNFYTQRDGYPKNNTRLTNRAADKDLVVIRGGSWDSSPVYLRTTFRESYPINKCSDNVGFRCAASIPR